MFRVPTAMEALRKSIPGMSQAALAKQIGKYQADISLYENGNLDPGSSILDRIAQALEYNGDSSDLLKPYNEVFGQTGPKSQLKETALA